MRYVSGLTQPHPSLACALVPLRAPKFHIPRSCKLLLVSNKILFAVLLRNIFLDVDGCWLRRRCRFMISLSVAPVDDFSLIKV